MEGPVSSAFATTTTKITTLVLRNKEQSLHKRLVLNDVKLNHAILRLLLLLLFLIHFLVLIYCVVVVVIILLLKKYSIIVSHSYLLS